MDSWKKDTYLKTGRMSKGSAWLGKVMGVGPKEQDPKDYFQGAGTGCEDIWSRVLAESLVNGPLQFSKQFAYATPVSPHSYSRAAQVQSGHQAGEGFKIKWKRILWNHRQRKI